VLKIFTKRVGALKFKFKHEILRLCDSQTTYFVGDLNSEFYKPCLFWSSYREMKLETSQLHLSHLLKFGLCRQIKKCVVFMQ